MKFWIKRIHKFIQICNIWRGSTRNLLITYVDVLSAEPQRQTYSKLGQSDIDHCDKWLISSTRVTARPLLCFFSINISSILFFLFQKTDETFGEISNHLDPAAPLEPSPLLIWEADVEIQSGDVLLVRIDDTQLILGNANETDTPYVERWVSIFCILFRRST